MVHKSEPRACSGDVPRGGELPDGLQELLRRAHVGLCDLQPGKVDHILAELEFLRIEDNSIPGTEIKIFTHSLLLAFNVRTHTVPALVLPPRDS